MTNSLRLAFATLALTAILPAGFAQTQPLPQADPAPALTLEECVARALGKNFDVSLQQLTTASAKDDVQVAKAVYDPNLSLETSKTFTKDPKDTSTT